MKGTVTKIDPVRTGSDGFDYVAVYFRLENGASAKTHICPKFRNYSRWKNLVVVGTEISGLTFKRNGMIDADCSPKLSFRPIVQPMLPALQQAGLCR
jgi:hypothetical protein